MLTPGETSTSKHVAPKAEPWSNKVLSNLRKFDKQATWCPILRRSEVILILVSPDWQHTARRQFDKQTRGPKAEPGSNKVLSTLRNFDKHATWCCAQS